MCAGSEDWRMVVDILKRDMEERERGKTWGEM
jgi:hypothetical protein